MSWTGGWYSFPPEYPNDSQILMIITHQHLFFPVLLMDPPFSPNGSRTSRSPCALIHSGKKQRIRSFPLLRNSRTPWFKRQTSSPVTVQTLFEIGLKSFKTFIYYFVCMCDGGIGSMRVWLGLHFGVRRQLHGFPWTASALPAVILPALEFFQEWCLYYTFHKQGSWEISTGQKVRVLFWKISSGTC